MYWPIAHMIAPAQQTVPCADCHRRGDGRLAALGGFYMPGRNRFGWLDILGGLAAVGTVLGVGVHGGLRLAASRKRRRRETEPDSGDPKRSAAKPRESKP